MCNEYFVSSILNAALKHEYSTEMQEWFSELPEADDDIRFAYARMKLLQKWFGTFECQRESCMTEKPAEFKLLNNRSHDSPPIFQKKYQKDVLFLKEFITMRRMIAFAAEFRLPFSNFEEFKSSLEKKLDRLKKYY